MRILSCLTVTALVLTISGCQKEETSSSDRPKTELITDGNWKFSKAISSGINVSAFIDDCFKDNIVSFQVNGNGQLDEGTTKCDNSDPQTVAFTWNLINNETVLHVSAPLFSGSNTDFELAGLNETELVVSQQVELGSGGSQKVTFTFVH